MAIADIHFIRPYWFLMLVPLAWLVWRIYHYVSQSNQWQRVCDSHLLNVLLVNETGHLRKWPAVFLALAWLLCVFALAGPSWSKIAQPVYRQQSATVIVMDLSPSMYAQDIKPSRIERARFKVMDLLRNMKEGQVAMVVFSGEPFIVSPLTQDAHTIASMVHVLNPSIMPVAGVDVSWALVQAGKLIHQAGLKSGQIWLLTADAGSQQAIATASSLRKQGITTSVMGIGTAQGAPIPLKNGGFRLDQHGSIMISKLNTSQLKRLAKAGGGIYVPFTNSNTDISDLLKQDRLNHLQMSVKKSKQSATLWRDDGRYFILLLLPLALLAFRKGVLV